LSVKKNAILRPYHRDAQMLKNTIYLIIYLTESENNNLKNFNYKQKFYINFSASFATIFCTKIFIV